MTTHNPDLLVKITDYASLQSDRWLFVASLLIGLGVFAWLIRYFVGQIKIIQERADAQTRIAQEKAERAYKDFNDHLQVANSKLTDALIRHSEALESNTSVIQRFLNK